MTSTLPCAPGRIALAAGTAAMGRLAPAPLAQEHDLLAPLIELAYGEHREIARIEIIGAAANSRSAAPDACDKARIERPGAQWRDV